jgi:hypothetical protein
MSFFSGSQSIAMVFQLAGWGYIAFSLAFDIAWEGTRRAEQVVDSSF